MAAYYNEFDPHAAAWLRELIKDGLIPDGEVDERDMREVDPEEIRGFTQYHFFAGIGGWAYALRLAGWPDDRPVMTGSPPCQPFSLAGKLKGKMNDTLHQRGLNSSESCNLQSFLENRLRMRLPRTNGLTIYSMHWKRKATPRGRLYYQLVASVRRTSGKDSGSPVSGWPTPTTRDWKDGAEQENVPINSLLGRQVWQITGETIDGCIVEMGSSDRLRLNPRFSLWLMGYPIEWAYCGERATPSSRRSQRKSSVA